MTIVVSVKVNEGIVLAADSVTSFFGDHGEVIKTYDYANKISNLVKVWPIGSLIYGAGGIGTSSISTISKDLRRQLDPRTSTDTSLRLDPNNFTIKEVAEKIRDYLFAKYSAAYPEPIKNYFLGYRVCGYSAGAELAEAWEIGIDGNQAFGPEPLYEDNSNSPEKPSFGIRWAGENEALDRLIFGQSGYTEAVLREIGVNEDLAKDLVSKLRSSTGRRLFLPAMPIQDAIDLAKFLAETAAGFSRFSLQPATVGGPIEIAAITKHEGFRWVSRKHYYSSEFNRGENYDA